MPAPPRRPRPSASRRRTCRSAAASAARSAPSRSASIRSRRILAGRAMSAPASTQDYYDRFAAGYEAERHHGSHRLIDELELELVRRYGHGRDVFEAGCGTGLLLREAAAVAR